MSFSFDISGNSNSVQQQFYSQQPQQSSFNFSPQDTSFTFQTSQQLQPQSSSFNFQTSQDASFTFQPHQSQPQPQPQQQYQQHQQNSLQLGVNDYINNINTNDVIRDQYGNIISYNLNSYKSYKDMREHMYNTPDMYIGSESHNLEKVMLLDLSKPDELHFYTADSTIPHAVKQTFKEILSNAADNILKSVQQGYKMSKYPLKVTMDRYTITVRNEGIPIPIVPAPSDPSMMKPEEIFGSFFQSQAYDNSMKSMTVARNGIGAKATSVFSTYFKVDIGVQGQGLRYEQVWENNMLKKNNYVITQYTGESYVQITYTLDFKRFQYTQYPDEALNLFAKEVVDAGFAGKFYSKFNDIPICVKNVTNYAKLIYGPNLPNNIVHYQWPDGAELVTKKGRKVAVDPRVVPLAEVMYLDTPGSAEKYGFVNGLLTVHGGIHVNAAYEVFSKEVIDIMTDIKDKKPKKAKEKKITPGKKRLPKITTKDVTNHVSLIVSVRMYKPKFDSQTKTIFTSYEVNGIEYTKLKIILENNIKKQLGHWQTLFALQRELQFKKLNALKSLDAKKRGRLPFIEKAQHAYLAGKPAHIHETMLIFVEGKSAKAWATTLIAQKPNGSDYWGVYPLKGKMLNSINADFEQQIGNPEYKEIIDMLRLQDLDYTIEANYKTLNYGKIAIATDADHDGKHIAGLFYLFIAHRYPTLLRVPGFINYIRTPIVRVKRYKKEKKLSFYSLYDYEVWLKGTPENPLPEEQIKHNKSFFAKYFKGLASAKPKDVKEDYESLRLVQMVCDYRTFESLKLAFDNKMADDRKFWMEAYKKVIGIENCAHLGYSDFINYEFIEFAITNVGRSIPGIDGLKESLRKCVYGSFLKWGAKAGERDAHQEKVIQLVGYIANKTGYHYGDNSLVMAINAMNRRWAGTNNMSLFWPKAMLGTRKEEGEDGGQARYTFTKLSPWIRDMFPKVDESLYKFVVDEGKEREPELLLPILPISMVNGALGIGTGYSTFIPNFYPPSLCEWIRNKLLGLPLPELYPWYNEYRGVISVEYKKDVVKKKRKVKEYDDIFGGDLNLDGVDSTSVDFYYKPGKGVELENVHNIANDISFNIGNQFDIRFDVSNNGINFNISEPTVVPGSEGSLKIDNLFAIPPQGTTFTTGITNSTPGISFDISGVANPVSISGVANSTSVQTPAEPAKTAEQMNADLHDVNSRMKKVYTRPSMTVVGIFRFVKHSSENYDVEIVEIPISVSFVKYASFLNKLVEQKKLSEFNNKSTDKFPHFLLYGLTFKPTIKSLRLRKNFGLTNMVLLDPITSKPVKYRSSQEIIEHFFNWRYPYYVKRKEFLLNEKQTKINEMNNRKKFILAAINYNETKVQVEGVNVRIMNLPKEQVYHQMRALGLFDIEKLLKSVASDKYLIESVKKLDIKIQEMYDDYNKLFNTPIRDLWIADLDKFLVKYYQNFEKLDGAGKVNGNIDFVKAEEAEEKRLKEEAKLKAKGKSMPEFDFGNGTANVGTGNNDVSFQINVSEPVNNVSFTF